MKNKHALYMISGALQTLSFFFGWVSSTNVDMSFTPIQIMQVPDGRVWFNAFFLIPLFGLILLYKGYTKRSPGIFDLLSLLTTGWFVGYFLYGHWMHKPGTEGFIFDKGLYMALFGLIFLLVAYFSGLDEEANVKNQQNTSV